MNNRSRFIRTIVLIIFLLPGTAGCTLLTPVNVDLPQSTNTLAAQTQISPERSPQPSQAETLTSNGSSTHTPGVSLASASPSPSTTVVPTETPRPFPTPVSGNWELSGDTLSYVSQLYQIKLAPLGIINDLAWSPDGHWLAAAGNSGVVLLDGEKMEIVRQLETKNRYNQLSFAANGTRLAAAGWGLTVQVWDLTDGRILQTIPSAGEWVALSPDGRFVAAAQDIDINVENYEIGRVDTIIRIYAVDSGKLLNTLTYKTGVPGWYLTVWSRTIGLYFSRDGQKLMTANDFGDVRVWNVTSGKLLSTTIMDYTRTRLSSGTCQVDGISGSTIALVCYIVYLSPPCEEETPGCNPTTKTRYEVGIWDTNQGKRIQSQAFQDNQGLFINLVYPAGGKKFILHHANQLEVWDLQNPTQPEIITGEGITAWSSRFVTCSGCLAPRLALNPVSSTLILAAGFEGKIEEWDINAVKRLGSFDSDTRIVTSATLGVMGGEPVLAAGLSDGSILLQDPADGSEIAKMTAGSSSIRQLAFGSDDGMLLSSSDEVLSVLKVGESVPRATYPISSLSSFYLSAATNLLAFMMPEQGISVHDLQTGSELYPIDTEYSRLLAISLDGLWLASKRPLSDNVAFWDLQTGKLLRQFSLPPEFYVYDAALSPDGSLFTLTLGSSIQVWDVNNGGIILQSELDGYAKSVAFSPGGCLLAAGSSNGNIYLYDLGTHQESTQWWAHSGDVQHLEFSRDGRLLLSLGGDGVASIWGQEGVLQLPAGEQKSLTCRLAGSPATSTPVTPTVTPTLVPFKRNLSLTDPVMRGDDIKQMQQRLLELGYTEVGTPDGVFGPKTDQAVRSFQERNGLVVDGVVGRITWDKLFSDTAVRKE